MVAPSNWHKMFALLVNCWNNNEFCGMQDMNRYCSLHVDSFSLCSHSCYSQVNVCFVSVHVAFASKLWFTCQLFNVFAFSFFCLSCKWLWSYCCSPVNQCLCFFFLFTCIICLVCMFKVVIVHLSMSVFKKNSNCSYSFNNIVFGHGCCVFWHRCFLILLLLFISSHFMVLLLFNFVVFQVIHFWFLGPSTIKVPYLKHKDSLLQPPNSPFSSLNLRPILFFPFFFISNEINLLKILYGHLMYLFFSFMNVRIIKFI